MKNDAQTSPRIGAPFRIDPGALWFLGLFLLGRHKKGISARQFQGGARGAGANSRTSFVTEAIHSQETTLFTDAWGSYAALRRLEIDHRPRKGGHGHQSVHLLPWAHRLFGNLKTWLTGTLHGGSPKHLQRYLDEFVFHFDHRWRETGLFVAVLLGALDGVPCPYGQLTAERIA